jgi:hypothetical protein
LHIYGMIPRSSQLTNLWFVPTVSPPR